MNIVKLVTKSKDLIFNEGTLLTRLLYGYYFQEAKRSQCLAALKAYQNSDGGFGNGLEPDLLCPGSSAIATETALYYLNMLNAPQSSIIEDIHYWVKHNLRPDGTIKHPPVAFEQYPYQPWWDKPDRWRSLAVVGQLMRIKNLRKNEAVEGLDSLFSEFPIGKTLEFYDYPFYLYTYALHGSNHPSIEHLLRSLPEFLVKNQTHFPLFSRYWYWIIPDVPKQVLNRELNKAVEALQEGQLPNPYPKLQHWNSLFTLDALIIIRHYNLL